MCVKSKENLFGIGGVCVTFSFFFGRGALVEFKEAL